MTSTWTLSEFLAHLRSLDVRLSLDGERLACNAPKGALTAELKTELQQRKSEIIAFLQSAATSDADDSVAPPITPLTDRSSLPLSFSQQRLWFLDKMEPGNPMYNVPITLRFVGTLDRDALERALRETFRRHESLRTSFREVDGFPRAVVGSVDTCNAWRVRVDDLTHVPADERMAELERRIRIEIQRPFDLARGPMMRATLFVVSDHEHVHEHVLTIVVHHIAADGWSLGVLGREFGQLYPAFHAGRPSPLPPLRVQYGDYAEWHRRWLEQGVLAKELPYWQRVLAPPLPVLELPLDHPRPPLQTHRGQRLAFSIPVSLTDALKQFSTRENVSLFMTLLAGFQILLSRYSGQPDVIVGTAVANRTRPELEDLIGFFVNNLVLRTDLSDNPTVREYLHRVRQVSLDGFAHQDVPFDRLVEVLRPERSLNRSPLFQTMFILQNWPLRDVELPNLRVTPMDIDSEIARFDLSIEAVEEAFDAEGNLTVPKVGETPIALRFHFEFNTDLFDAETIRRMQRHYETVLSAMVATPECRVAQLSLMPAQEAETMLVAWNATTMSYPDTACAHELIEAQAAQTPEAEAVRFGDQRLTYRELMQRANQLAHRLRAMGVQSDSLVGICVERSHEMLVATLAVWKAGGAYVPLDPSYPTERLAFMAEDAKLAALITESALLDTVPAPACPVVCLDRDRGIIAAEPDTPPDVLACPAQLAYVIYTSGSTGKPKGVLVEHRSLVNFLLSMRNTPGMQRRDTLLSVTTLSFDIAGLELYLPLVAGARVVLASRAVATDGLALAQLMHDAGVTIMQATPATWRLLLDSGWSAGQGLTILCGGEALPRQLADALLATGATVWNMYGPTETTIWSTIHRVQPDEDPVPIGQPIANTAIYILDPYGAPVPVNVAGELFIGGDGLARGYHNRPALTAERFVPNPFVNASSGLTPARMYRTGDQARYRPDGTIEYLGRLDHQVKVRGFRIELGEIESVLSAHPQVQHAVVMAREDVPGDQRLVAYLIATPETPSDALTSAPLRAWLSERLPIFMVPSAFVVLETFPLTPNGKVDRRALPAPKDVGSTSTAAFISPRSGIESAVADLWREILRVERVGSADNFFDLGGHSLLVVQLQSKMRERFQCEISLMELFRRPTVSAMAEFIAAKTPSTAPANTSPTAHNPDAWSDLVGVHE